MSQEFATGSPGTAPLAGMVPQAVQLTTVVEDVRLMARDTWAVRLRAPEIAARITPGQFFMLRPAHGSDPLLGRPFALYDVWTDAECAPAGVEFGFVRVGKLTSLMSHWQEGTEVTVWGPLGNGFPVPRTRNLICVAGGIGQTPFLAVIREALGQRSYGSPKRRVPARPDSVTLCYGVRSAEYLAGLDEFRLPGLDLRIATDNGSSGHHGFVTELLRQRLSETGRSAGAGHPVEIDETVVYCCGPVPMMNAVAEICRERGVPCWLSLETPMACGFGACFSCVVKVIESDGTWDYRRTCVEGPVFEATRLALT